MGKRGRILGPERPPFYPKPRPGPLNRFLASLPPGSSSLVLRCCRDGNIHLGLGCSDACADMSCIGHFLAVWLPAAAGWRSWEHLGGSGGISPDGMVFLERSPYGPTRAYFEYERTARGEARVGPYGLRLSRPGERLSSPHRLLER